MVVQQIPYKSKQRAGQSSVFPLARERLVSLWGWDPLQIDAYILESRIFQKRLWPVAGGSAVLAAGMLCETSLPLPHSVLGEVSCTDLALCGHCCEGTEECGKGAQLCGEGEAGDERERCPLCAAQGEISGPSYH